MSVNKNKIQRGGSKNARLKILLMFVALAGVICGAAITLIAARIQTAEYRKEVESLKQKVTEVQHQTSEPDKATQSTEAQASETAAEQLKKEDDSFALTLISSENRLDPSYKPALTDIGQGFQMDTRAASHMKEMLAAAEKEGLSMLIISAYRSYNDQKQVFSTTMQQWIDQGYSLFDSYEETKKSVAVPGTSEHASGLAADITSASYTGLDDKQANTKEAQWLMQHSYEYGFILRYPPSKSSITGIVFEPWHYRYVGKEAAKEIHDQGITMEEYLDQKTGS